MFYGLLINFATEVHWAAEKLAWSGITHWRDQTLHSLVWPTRCFVQLGRLLACDELTVWRLDCVTSWLCEKNVPVTSWPVMSWLVATPTPHENPETLQFLAPKISAKFEWVTPMGAPNAGRVQVKIGDIQQITLYNSKTVGNICIVSIKVEQEVVYSLSNGYVADDLVWPFTISHHPNYIFCIAFHIFLEGKFGVQVDHSKTQPMDNKISLKGAASRHVTYYKLLCP